MAAAGLAPMQNGHSLSLDAAVWTYGLSCLCYLGFSAYLWLRRRDSGIVRLVLSVSLISAAWAFAGAFFARTISTPAWALVNVADVVRYLSWYLTLLALAAHWQQGGASRLLGFATENFSILGLPFVLGASVAAGNLLAVVVQAATAHTFVAPTWIYLAFLIMAVAGLILTEQLYRNHPRQSRWGIKPVTIGLAGLFAFDLYLYSEAYLLGRLDRDIWSARGLVHALLIPLVALSVWRNRGWTNPIVLSHRLVFHSAAVLGSGAYLLLVAGAGYYITYFGGTWGRVLQVSFLSLSILLLSALLLSGSARSRLKVALSKHLFSYRYDYREEWLGFTRALTTHDPHHGFHQVPIKALADLVESPGGGLWLQGPEGDYRPVGHWNFPGMDKVLRRDDVLVGRLREGGEVILVAGDVEVLPEWLLEKSEAWLVVPLLAIEDLVGFIVLARPRADVEVNWEVKDLLRTAGRQAASYLGQMRALEALIEARRFDAMNRMAAFVVHDLKNLVSQLSLMTRNAERHWDKPEFRDDMLLTVNNVVGRMQHLLLQLRDSALARDRVESVDVAALVRRLAGARNDPRLTVSAVPNGGELLTRADPARLSRIIGHLVQNGLEAVDARSGRVQVLLAGDGDCVRVTVDDNGPGMSRNFMESRLFKPFQTTKAGGMGIGMYECRQYIGELGGRMEVESEPGHGVHIRLSLPRGSGGGNNDEMSESR